MDQDVSRYSQWDQWKNQLGELREPHVLHTSAYMIYGQTNDPEFWCFQKGANKSTWGCGSFKLTKVGVDLLYTTGFWSSCFFYIYPSQIRPTSPRQDHVSLNVQVKLFPHQSLQWFNIFLDLCPYYCTHIQPAFHNQKVGNTWKHNVNPKSATYALAAMVALGNGSCWNLFEAHLRRAAPFFVPQQGGKMLAAGDLCGDREGAWRWRALKGFLLDLKIFGRNNMAKDKENRLHSSIPF